MREITTHKVNDLNKCIVVNTFENAPYEYRISGVKGPLDHHPIPTIEIRFQNGPIADVGANGITIESLLAVVIDRLQGFQQSQFNCRENACAITKLEEAMHWLQHRTNERLKRGVEGTHQK